MGKRDKKAEKKKRKRRSKALTNEEILKIIKKLKPKTQQTVRVVVGDQGKKKEASNLIPPFIFPSPSPSYPAIVNLGQAPAPIAPPPNPVANPVAAEADIAEAIKPKSTRGKKPVFTDTETEMDNKIIAKQRSIEDYYSTGRFQKPKIMNPSDLSYKGSFNSKMTNMPSNNDPYLSARIQTNTMDTDQRGLVSSTTLPSSNWTGTPSGEPIDLEEEQQQKETMTEQLQKEIQPEILPPLPPSEEEQTSEALSSFGEIPEDEFSKLIEESAKEESIKLREPTVPQAPKPSKKAPKKPIEFKVLESYQYATVPGMTADINEAIDLGYADVPPNFLYKVGAFKGKLKKNIKFNDLYPIYEDVYEKGFF
jgi:hypothetical protein